MLVFDIIVIAILVISTIRYAKKGVTGVVLDIVGYVVSAIVAWAIGANVGSWLFESAIAKALPDAVNEHLLSAKSIAGALGFIVVFLIAIIIWKILSKGLNKIFNIPVIGQVNKILGALLGLLLGYLLIQVLVLIVFVPLHFFKDSASEIMASSYVARWFYEHNLIRALFGFN